MLVRNYMVAYIRKWYDGSDPQEFQNRISWYSGVMTHMLISHGQMPKRRLDIGKRIKKTVKGKKILELGCREGFFIEFLMDHGAKVAGTTGGNYLPKAERMMGGKAVLVDSTTEDAGESRILRKFKPEIIVSVNYFDRHRWGRKRGVPEGFIRSISKLARKDSQVFVLPAIDTDPVSHKASFRKGFRNFEELRHPELIFRRGKPYSTIQLGAIRERK